MFTLIYFSSFVIYCARFGLGFIINKIYPLIRKNISQNNPLTNPPSLYDPTFLYNMSSKHNKRIMFIISLLKPIGFSI
jgi:hypothetical protein